MSSVEEHYKRWEDPELVDRFAAKQVGDFFRSESRFLEKHGHAIASVLDIGCASGRMLDLLRQHAPVDDYTGVDIVAENIERGRSLFPDANFVVGNALAFRPDRTYDLVNATGVCQHEPQFDKLIAHMCTLSHRYVMFDVKLALIRDHVVDVEASSTGRSPNRLYYILLSWRPFLSLLRALPGIREIEVFGYETAVSSAVQLPPDVDRVVSAGVALTRGETQSPALNVDVPAWLTEDG